MLIITAKYPKTSIVVGVVVVVLTGSGPVKNVTTTEVTATSAKAAWLNPNYPNGIIFYYHIILSIQKENSSEYENIMVFKEDPSQNVLYLSDMKPYRKYQISVSAFTAAGRGNPTSIEFMTESSIPGPPHNVTAEPTGSKCLVIRCFYPKEPRGIIRGYRISLSKSPDFSNREKVYYKRVKKHFANRRDAVVKVIINLVPHTAYYAMIQACAYEYDARKKRYGAEVIIGPVYMVEPSKLLFV